MVCTINNKKIFINGMQEILKIITFTNLQTHDKNTKPQTRTNVCEF